MTLADRLFMAGVRALPRRTLSRSARRWAAVRSKMAVRQYAARFDVDVDEAEKPLDDYESVLELFTRRLKPGARPIDPRPDVMVSPVDGTLACAGPVGDGTLVQAKGRRYSLDALLDEERAGARCRRGAYFTLYLSPRDYHRVHAPAQGRILGYRHVPGDLFPVNARSTGSVEGLYARNERVVTRLDTRFGRIDVVKIGATNVGRIALSYAPELVTNAAGSEPATVEFDAAIEIGRGDELAVFEIGSTVVVVTERPFETTVAAAPRPIRLGEPLARQTSGEGARDAD